MRAALGLYRSRSECPCHPRPTLRPALANILGQLQGVLILVFDLSFDEKLDYVKVTWDDNRQMVIRSVTSTE